jgi:hypothetical protein
MEERLPLVAEEIFSRSNLNFNVFRSMDSSETFVTFHDVLIITSDKEVPL